MSTGRWRPATRCLTETNKADQELETLASTLMRATYHRRRFAWIVSEATARYEAHKSNIIFDQIAKYIAFEAAGVLGAARSFVDGVYYVARRRAGATLDEVDDVPISQAITNAQSVAYGLPELGVLRRQHLKWYEALNLYRNVLVHVGAGDSMAFFPAGVMLPAGVEPATNVMVVPDAESLKATIAAAPGQKKKRATRTTRPHEWSYRRNTRLDTLVKDSYEGLLTFGRAIGTLWGSSIPARGETDWIDAVVLRET